MPHYIGQLLEKSDLALALLAVVLLAAGALGSVYLAVKLLAHRAAGKDHHPEGNGHAKSSGSTAALKALERKQLEEMERDIRDLHRQVYDPQGAVRKGDHDTRNALQTIHGEVMREMRSLGSKVDTLSGGVGNLAVTVSGLDATVQGVVKRVDDWERRRRE
jgi:hypothetical protein